MRAVEERGHHISSGLPEVVEAVVQDMVANLKAQLADAQQAELTAQQALSDANQARGVAEQDKARVEGELEALRQVQKGLEADLAAEPSDPHRCGGRPS